MTTGGQQAVAGSEVIATLRQKLHLHNVAGRDDFTLPSGECSLNSVHTGSDARIYGANGDTAVSPDHSAVVIIDVITSGGGAPAGGCLPAIKRALGWG